MKSSKKALAKKAKRAAAWKKTELALLEKVGHICEICHHGTYLLHGHHITGRASGDDSEANCIILCRLCHNHDKYPKGTSLSIEQLQDIVRKR